MFPLCFCIGNVWRIDILGQNDVIAIESYTEVTPALFLAHIYTNFINLSDYGIKHNTIGLKSADSFFIADYF